MQMKVVVDILFDIDVQGAAQLKAKVSFCNLYFCCASFNGGFKKQTQDEKFGKKR